VQWKIENGDTVGMYSFDIPELDEDMMNQLQESSPKISGISTKRYLRRSQALH